MGAGPSPHPADGAGLLPASHTIAHTGSHATVLPGSPELSGAHTTLGYEAPRIGYQQPASRKPVPGKCSRAGRKQGARHLGGLFPEDPRLFTLPVGESDVLPCPGHLIQTAWVLPHPALQTSPRLAGPAASFLPNLPFSEPWPFSLGLSHLYHPPLNETGSLPGRNRCRNGRSAQGPPSSLTLLP